MRKLRRLTGVCILQVGLLLVMGFAAGGCSTATKEGAVSGGIMGFVGGAAVGAVDALLFGGGHNILENAGKAAVLGAAGGAATGATAAHMSEKKAQKSADPMAPDSAATEKLRKKYGDVNFQAAVQLVQCQHKSAMATAERGFEQADNMERKIFALTILSAAQTEIGQAVEAEKTFSRMILIDSTRTMDKARADSLQTLLKVQSIRKQQGIKPFGS